MNGSPVPALFGTVIYAHAADQPWTPTGSLIAALVVIAVVGFAIGLIVVVLLGDTKGEPPGRRVLRMIGRFFGFVVVGAGAAVAVALMLVGAVLLLLLQFWLKSQTGIDIHFHPVP
jgi:hypothetical protein